MIDTLLIANRGEIACRIMRSARLLGIRCVAVYSDADSDARHVREADLAIHIGAARASDSYLCLDALIEAAHRSSAQAIHPGYGFLSENASLADACAAAGLIFVGPPAAAMAAMGNKSAAKALMEAAGVPVVPGYHAAEQSESAFLQAARRIGYPVLLKPVAGGGGKGMKAVACESQLIEAIRSAQREAMAAFGDARLLLEKHLQQPRHIEIQLLADHHGQVLHLNERDCSIQRRHQKILEEAPASGLSATLRQAMGAAAVRAAQAIDYRGAGTLEFLLDHQGAFYFMEMNTRLQVEHPVSEAISGLDLVEWQLRVACGERLPWTQAQVPLKGHAIEARLYAEDCNQDFLPTAGPLQLYLEPAAGEGRRIDSGVFEGQQITPYYDPLLAKLIAWGRDREQARQRLLHMLDECAIGGIASNLGLLQRLLEHPSFIAGELDTGFIERHRAELLPATGELPERFWQLAGSALLLSEPPRQQPNDPHSPWAAGHGWRSAQPPASWQLLHSGQQQYSLRLPAAGLSELHWDGSRLSWQADGIRQHCPALVRDGCLYLRWQGEFHAVRRLEAGPAGQPEHSAGNLQAPMNASVVRILVHPGQSVQAGSPLVVLEAMKMEHSLCAPSAGRVKALLCREGERVSAGQQLLELD